MNPLTANLHGIMKTLAAMGLDAGRVSMSLSQVGGNTTAERQREFGKLEVKRLQKQKGGPEPPFLAVLTGQALMRLDFTR